MNFCTEFNKAKVLPCEYSLTITVNGYWSKEMFLSLCSLNEWPHPKPPPFKSVLIFSLAVRNIESTDKILSLGLADFDRFGVRG